MSQKIITNTNPTPHHNNTYEDILIAKAVDLPLYINIEFSNKDAKDLLAYRLKENVTDVHTSDEIVSKYWIVDLRAGRLRRIESIYTSILMMYIKRTYHRQVYSKNGLYLDRLFELTINGRTYIAQFKTRYFQWIRLPEEYVEVVSIPNDISDTFFAYPETDVGLLKWMQVPV